MTKVEVPDEDPEKPPKMESLIKLFQDKLALNKPKKGKKGKGKGKKKKKK